MCFQWKILLSFLMGIKISWVTPMYLSVNNFCRLIFWWFISFLVLITFILFWCMSHTLVHIQIQLANKFSHKFSSTWQGLWLPVKLICDTSGSHKEMYQHNSLFKILNPKCCWIESPSESFWRVYFEYFDPFTTFNCNSTNGNKAFKVTLELLIVLLQTLFVGT